MIFKYFFFSCEQNLVSTTLTTLTTKMITKIPTTSLANCVDKDEFYCRRFRSFVMDNCKNKNFFYQGYQLGEFCCKTCQQFERNCFDSNIDCKFLSRFCNVLDRYNPHPCQATCNKC